MSPLFRRRSEEEKESERAASQARNEASARAAEQAAISLERIEQGHIPLQAAERLKEFAPASAEGAAGMNAEGSAGAGTASTRRARQQRRPSAAIWKSASGRRSRAWASPRSRR